MDVELAVKGGDQRRILRDVGEDPQLDLAVVGRHQAPARLGDEGAPNRLPQLGADRDVLQVRVRRRQPLTKK